jgi:hypothetical protein
MEEWNFEILQVEEMGQNKFQQNFKVLSPH